MVPIASGTTRRSLPWYLYTTYILIVRYRKVPVPDVCLNLYIRYRKVPYRGFASINIYIRYRKATDALRTTVYKVP